MRTIIDGVLLHDSAATVIAIKVIIVGRRRAGEISAERARDAFTDIDLLDYDDLECHVEYLLSNSDVFGAEYWGIIRGRVFGRMFGAPVIFCDALRSWVRDTRAANGALYGEVLKPGGLGMFRQQAC